SLLLSPPTPPTACDTLSLHDALPISAHLGRGGWQPVAAFHVVPRGTRSAGGRARPVRAVRPDRRDPRAGRWWFQGDVPAAPPGTDRKSTRLNSSHVSISYAVFCLKKK